MIVALLLPALIGTAGLVVEYGHGVLEKVENQRIADLSAYAGAVAYNSTRDQNTMIAAASGVALLNGIAASKVVTSLVASPTGKPSVSAVKVVVTTRVSLIFSRLLGASSTLAVPAESYAELRPSVDSCILALSASAGGVALTGGTTVSAPTCTVASNAAVSVPCGSKIYAAGLAYNSAAAPVQCISAPNILGPAGGAASMVKKSTPDPLAANADIAAARARLTTFAALVAPAVADPPPAPVVPLSGGTFLDLSLDIYNASGNPSKTQAVALGCVATNSGTAWTVTCAAGSHRINNLSVGGGQTASFVGGSSTNYYFAQPTSTGPAINFGAGNFTFQQGLTIGYGGATFGAGALAIAGNLLATGGTAVFGSTNISVTGNATLTGVTTLSGTGTLAVGGGLTTGGTTVFGSTNISVTGNATLAGVTTLSGTGTLAVGGGLTISGTPTVAQSAITVTGAFTVTKGVSFNALTSLKVGGLTSFTDGTLRFAGGNYTLTGGLQTGGSTVITIGAGTYAVGRSAVNCNGAQFSICSNAASMIIAGPSVFALRSGVTVGGGSTVVLGNGGTANSFQIGISTNGNAVQIGGGSLFRMGDATGPESVFQIGGNFNVASGGGSCTVIGAAPQHDINGSLTTAGATILGAGVYTVAGSVGIGSNGGGNASCNGQNVGLLANGVSLVIGATGAGLTGTCYEQAFCVAAGYSNVVLTAPASGSYARMAIIGPLTGTRGAYFTEGSSGTTLSGLVYFPTGSVRLDGAASVGSGSGECLQLIGKDIALNGGSVLASACISGGTTGGKVVLVQ